MAPEIISMFAQLPLVGIFVWFIFKWTEKLDKALALRQKEQSETTIKIEKSRTESDEKRDENWREFLREERQHRVDSNIRFANEIGKIGETLLSIQAITISHDARASQYINGRIQDDT